ncbi:MAG: hypothetical protein AAF456_01545 [Planctomycetota bacterium]
MAETWQKLDIDVDFNPTGESDPMIEYFFPFFKRVAEDNRLALVTVDWVGCPACFSESEYIRTLGTLPGRYDGNGVEMAFGSLHWRSPEGFRYTNPDLIDVVNPSYKLFHQMTGRHEQVYGGRRNVETFTANPPNWRPKFPQLFFIDGREISAVGIEMLTSLYESGHLFHPFIQPPNAGGDPWVRSGDLNFTDDLVRRAVWNALGPQAVLLQLNNFHLYRAPGDRNEDFMKDAMLASCDHVVEQFEAQPETPQLSFRYERFRDTDARTRLPAIEQLEPVAADAVDSDGAH